MDLSALNSSLPPGLADAERDMGDKFRASALSITTLYKSSLQYTKQAYQVGYSAALADVLSKVQSDIGAGEDAAVALARLMDWTEARQTAMDIFAAEEDEAQPQTAARNGGASTSRQIPPRPASAPGPDRSRNFTKSAPPPSSQRSDAMDADEPAQLASSSSSQRRATATASEPTPETLTLPAPVTLPSSSPNSSPMPRTFATPRLQRSMSGRTPSSSGSSTMPTSSFNFSLPPLPNIEIPNASGTPSQQGSLGSKRPIIDTEMADGPSTPVRGGRAAKRRTLLPLSGNVGEGAEEKEPRSGERRRGGRRGGSHAA